MADELLDENIYKQNTTILPPNSGGNNAINRVDAATLGSYSPNGQNYPSSDVDYINSQINPLGGQNPAIPNATNDMFVPFDPNVRDVGGTTGGVVGYQPIHLAGGFQAPFAALEQRRYAQQDAAIKRANDLKGFKLQKPKLSKDPRFNRNLVNTANEYTNIFISQAEKEYGSREAAMRALTDSSTKIGREFIQQMDNLEILAGEVDQVVDLSAKVDTAIEKGDKYISPETRKLNNEMKTLTGDFEGGNAFGAASLRNTLNKLQLSTGFDAYLKDQGILNNIDAVIMQTAGAGESGDNYRESTHYTENFSKAAREQAKSMHPNFPQMTEDEIYNRLINLKGSVDKKTSSIKSKPKDSDGGYSKIEDVIITEDPKIIDISGTQVKTKKSVPYPRLDKQEPTKIDSPIIIGANGEGTTYNGIMEFIPVENHLLKDGSRVVSGKQIRKTSDMSKEELKSRGFKVDDLDGRTIPETITENVTIEYKNSKNALSSTNKTMRLVNQVFDNIAPETIYKEVLVDKDNVGTTFRDDFINSEFETIDEYIKDQKEKNIKVILNKSAKDEINRGKSRFFKKPLSDRDKKVSNRKYTPEQETLIDQVLKDNPTKTREQVIEKIGLK